MTPSFRGQFVYGTGASGMTEKELYAIPLMGPHEMQDFDFGPRTLPECFGDSNDLPVNKNEGELTSGRVLGIVFFYLLVLD